MDYLLIGFLVFGVGYFVGRFVTWVVEKDR